MCRLKDNDLMSLFQLNPLNLPRYETPRQISETLIISDKKLIFYDLYNRIANILS